MSFIGCGIYKLPGVSLFSVVSMGSGGSAEVGVGVPLSPSPPAPDLDSSDSALG